MPSPKRRQKPLMTERAIEAEAAALRLLIEGSVSPFEKDTKAKREARIKRAEHDLDYFARTYFPHILTDKSPEFHLKLDEAAKAKRAAVQVFRGGSKTTRIFRIGVIHDIIFVSEDYVQYFTATDKLAERKLDTIRAEIELNKRLHNDFGIEPGRAWNTDLIICNNVCIDAHGLGSAIRGATDHLGRRPTKIIVDDVDEKKKVESADQRQKLRDNILGDVIPGLNPKRGKIIVIGTAIHPECLIQWCLRDDRFKDWLKLDILAENRVTGELTWPERFDRSHLDEMLTLLGPAVYSAEFLNQPIDPSTAELTEDEIQYFSDLDLSRVDIIAVIGALDPSLGKNQKADFQAIVGGHVIKASNGHIEYWISLADLGRRTLPKLIGRIFHYHKEFRFTAFGFEVVAFQEALKQWVEEKAAETGILLNAVAVTNSGGEAGKSARIRSTLGFYKKGQVRLHESLRNTEFVRQLTNFPKGHDDGPDAAEMFLRIAAKYRGGEDDGLSSAGDNYVQQQLNAHYFDLAAIQEYYAQ